MVSPWLGADVWSSSRKLVRSLLPLDKVPSTLEMDSLPRDLESVQTLSERRKLHVYSEQKAELAATLKKTGDFS